MIACGFIMFVIFAFTSVRSYGQAFSPALLVLPIVLFMGGAIMLAITLSKSAASGTLGKHFTHNTSTEESGTSLSSKMFSLLDSFDEIDQEFQTGKTTKGKQAKSASKKTQCANCGNKKLNDDGSCPYCGC